MLLRLRVSCVLTLAACSPTLDWREWRPPGSGVVLQLPCKPVPQARKLRLAGVPVQLALHACSAGGQTWALSYADVADPARVGAALNELRASALANVGAAQGQAITWLMPGATPNEQSGRLLLQGRLPDGKAVQEQVAVFAIGTTVLQATVIGESLPADGIENFFGSLRVAR
jgi:hypothetical protein